MHSVEHIAGELRKKRLKLTPQRRLILETLVSDRSHPTVEEVYSRVITVMPEVSKTTVYNTIRELVSMGELREVQGLSDSGVRYDTCGEDHHHFFCLACKTLVDVDAPAGRNAVVPGGGFEALKEYAVVRTEITLYGYCPECRKSGAERV